MATRQSETYKCVNVKVSVCISERGLATCMNAMLMAEVKRDWISHRKRIISQFKVTVEWIKYLSSDSVSVAYFIVFIDMFVSSYMMVLDFQCLFFVFVSQWHIFFVDTF